MPRLHPKSSPCRPPGFTLIELLVCITIITLLMAILLPTLRQARERARIVLCATQLRQWGVVYANYAGDFRDFFGGVTSFELRDCFTATNYNWAPDNVAPWNYTDYQESPWNRSTIELSKRGLQHTWTPSQVAKSGGITRCPSRIASGYGQTVGESWGANGLGGGGSLIYVDYFVFAGFSNRRNSEGIPHYVDVSTSPITLVSDPWSGYWGQPLPSMGYGFLTGWQFTPPANANRNMRYPPTHLRQKMSLRSIMVMDRHWTRNSNSYYGYNDIGNLSNHATFASGSTVVGASPEGPTGHTLTLASGSNALLLDMSVTFTPYSMTNTADNTQLGGDYCRRFYVGPNLKNP